MERAIHQTMSALNDALAAWINGSVSDDDRGFATVARLCDPSLSVVHPDGSAAHGGKGLAALRAAHGRNPDFRLATPAAGVRLIARAPGLVVAEVIELQDAAQAVARSRHARRLTVALGEDDSAPHGLVLLHMHESLVPESEEKNLDWSPLGDGAGG